MYGVEDVYLMMTGRREMIDPHPRDIGDELTKDLKQNKEDKEVISPTPVQGGMVGWTCPRCGRGDSPFSSTCPCVPMPAPTITC